MSLLIHEKCWYFLKLILSITRILCNGALSECALIASVIRQFTVLFSIRWQLRVKVKFSLLFCKYSFVTINSFMWTFIRSSLMLFCLHFIAIHSQVTWTSIHYSPVCTSLFAEFYLWMWRGRYESLPLPPSPQYGMASVLPFWVNRIYAVNQPCM